MPRLSYWVFPIISGVVWLATLLAMLIYWTVGSHKYHYPSMAAGQDIAYISDIGAYELKPLFIAGCVVTTVFLDISFGADRWLRHKGRLVPNTTTGEKILSGLTILFAVVGTVGLICLSVFDQAHYKRLHDIFLLLFIGGYCLSAIFICWEYQRLGIRNPQHHVLSTSFWIKLVFVVVVLILAVAFIATTFTRRYNAGACLEWTIALLFSLYIFSFVVDLYPAVRTANGETGRRYRKRRGTPKQGAGSRFVAALKMENGRANGHGHGHGHGHSRNGSGHRGLNRVQNNF